MTPVVIIPVFISSIKKKLGDSVLTTYDHTTPISSKGELPRLLDSLKNVKDISHVIILVIAESTVNEAACVKIERLTMQYSQFNTMVIGADEVEKIHKRAKTLGLPDVSSEISLSSYGAIRNVGITVASLYGFDAAIFLDDDCVVNDPDFLHKAMYAMGKLTKQGVPIVVKTGYYLNRHDSYLSRHKNYWHDRLWQKGKAYNAWITKAMQGVRLTRSLRICGGCMVLHKQAYLRLAFDPWVTRGEDLDYLLNLRMYGSDVWFDNKLVVHHLPPEIPSEGVRFQQDIFRWLYEYRKLEYSRTQIDLLQVKASDLKPYPGDFLGKDIERRIKWTARLRSLGRPDKKEYRRACKIASLQAKEFASRNCQNYFEFQRVWPVFINTIKSDEKLIEELELSGHQRRRIAYHQMQAENDLDSAKRAYGRMSRAKSIKRENIDPGQTSEIHLNLN